MRSLLLSVLCVTPTVFVACGADPAPGRDDHTIDDTTADTTADPTDTDASSHGTPRAIAASLDIGSPSCDLATASYEALVRHVDDSSFVPNVRCRVTFDDGAVSELCTGEHTFASAGAHTFAIEVEDLDTGATARAETTRTIDEPLAAELAVDVPTCGLEVAFHGTLSTRADVHVSMSPADRVVVPNVVGTAGSFTVLEAGTYTITLSAEVERPSGPICVREVSQAVTLTACGPDCGQ